jgi:hypothetical protein
MARVTALSTLFVLLLAVPSISVTLAAQATA